MDRQIVNSNALSIPLSARRLHHKILTLLALSPTYSCEIEFLKTEVGWNEPKYGSFEDCLNSIRHDGKLLYSIIKSDGQCRIHLIKDIYLNAVSQRLRAFHEKHYKASSDVLTVDQMRRFIFWDCPTRVFREWMVNHGLSSLLVPPTSRLPDESHSISGRTRPQVVRTFSHLLSALGFVRQQYNLISIVCYSARSARGLPQLSLVRLTQANKQVLLIDVQALAEEARHENLHGTLCAAPFAQELKALMESQAIRKCVWDFRADAARWHADFGATPHGLIDLFPIVRHFFPELLVRAPAGGDPSGLPLPRTVAEALCPQWRESAATAPVAGAAPSDWRRRPLTAAMLAHAGAIGAGLLLEVRKGVRTEISTRVNEKMAHLSDSFHDCASGKPPHVASLDTQGHCLTIKATWQMGYPGAEKTQATD
eukprot:TRINITY_DN9577_c0_g1_i1.p1 TRINITY_DN9577_c0_g1~~TRINITY_DN9577_c0_g1_i1.p1  ORF type:complete len:424 (+),score=64.65 TRINITY_DN9577_c0_g1_i1:50-1321(+)